ncbi:multiple sugar transport system permease protein [Paenibacillus sp. V4I9]|uniref:carbohydrate ABC transporter permease n=1 Tax=Paenibacillus sp. V4I9 TaxID=3042308 RepID=UPI0027879BAB|nr:sugar ABC transporter permease [Paenibacillus sp. V4I9]MDQ0892249.1 multiple sugar transport system permease protein [Paenibacillus sp. V4I9]
MMSQLTRGAKWFSSWNSYLFVLPALVFMAVFVIFPIAYNVTLSFQDVNVYNLKGEHHFIGLSNYIKSLKDPVFYISMKNSVVFTVLSIFFQFAIGFGLALFFNMKFLGRNLFRSLMLLSWMLPVVITGTIFQWMFSGDYGVINYFLQSLGLISKPISWLSDANTALLGTIVANIWTGIPFNMIILLSGLQTLPTHLYEAAKLDGANRFLQFRHITLPLLRPTILVLFMLGIIYTFKVFDLVFIMTAGGPVTASTVLPIYAYQLSFTTFEFSQGAAVSMIMFLMLIVIAIVYLRMSNKEEVH